MQRGWVEGRVDGWEKGRVGGRMGRWKDGRMEMEGKTEDEWMGEWRMSRWIGGKIDAKCSEKWPPD